MKIISYSLYGIDARYTVPLDRNASSLHLYYPGWIVRVYHDDSVAKETLEKLELNNVQLVNINHPELLKYNLAPKFWRFLPILDKDVDVVIFRDSDSIFSQRESEFVNEWLCSDKNFHVIRDHQLHISPILAGMFGVKRDGFDLFSRVLFDKSDIASINNYNSDQIFLADYLYKDIVNLTLIHTAYFALSGEKYTRVNKNLEKNGFIGAVYLNNESSNDILFDYDFIVGIPYWLAKLCRYKIRLVLYLSYVHSFFKSKKRENASF